MAADSYGLARQTEPAEPAEADYQAFYDALMDDERGRWFLAEYSRRNRNADTGVLLKALNRVEALVRRGTPDVLDPPRRELRAIAVTIRQARAEANSGAGAAHGEKLLALLDQVERRIDAMIGERAEPAKDPPQAPHSQLTVVPQAEPAVAASETPEAGTVSAAMMPPVAWAAGDAAIAAGTPAAIAETAGAESALADIAPSPPGNENQPATVATTPVAAAIAAEPALQNWMSVPAVPIAVAFGDAHDVVQQLQDTAPDFALPAMETAQEHAGEPAPVVAPEKIQAAEQATLREPDAGIAAGQNEVPPEIGPPAEAQAIPAAASAIMEFAEPQTPALALAAAGGAPASGAAIGEAATAAVALESTATTTPDSSFVAAADAMDKAMAEIAMAITSNTIEQRIAAANALPALAALSEEERLALFT